MRTGRVLPFLSHSLNKVKLVEKIIGMLLTDIFK